MFWHLNCSVMGNKGISMRHFLALSFLLSLSISYAANECPDSLYNKRFECDSFDQVKQQYVYGGATSVLIDESTGLGKIVSVVAGPNFEDRFETNLEKTESGYESIDRGHSFKMINSKEGNLTRALRSGGKRVYRCKVQSE